MLAEILIFMIIAGFFLYRLYNVLGNVSEEQEDLFKNLKKQQKSNQEDIKIVGEKTADDNQDISSGDFLIKSKSFDVQNKIATITTIDRNFSEEYFLNGVKYVFVKILHAFSSNQKDIIKQVTAPSIAQALSNEIDRRIAAQEKHHTELLRIIAIEIKNITINNHTVEINVDIESEQINSVSKTDHTVEKINRPEIINDDWVFYRNLDDDRPDWYVIKL